MGQNESDEMKFWTKEEYMKFIPTMANKTYSYMAFESLMELIISLYLMRSIITSNLKREITPWKSGSWRCDKAVSVSACIPGIYQSP